jgi:hypothetical protein
LTRRSRMVANSAVASRLVAGMAARTACISQNYLAAAGETLQIGALVVAELDRAGLPHPPHAAPRIACTTQGSTQFPHG